MKWSAVDCVSGPGYQTLHRHTAPDDTVTMTIHKPEFGQGNGDVAIYAAGRRIHQRQQVKTQFA